MISTRDVLFDENTFFSGKSEVTAEAIPEVDSLMARIELPEGHVTNEVILEEDDAIEPLPVDPEDEEPGEGVAVFDEKEDYELARALEEALLTPPPSEVDPEAALHVQLPFGTPDAQEQAVCMACSQGVAADSEERFDDFNPERITSTFQGAFVAARRFKTHKRDLPPAPKTIRDLRGHPYEAEFRKAQLDHLESHRQIQS